MSEAAFMAYGDINTPVCWYNGTGYNPEELVTNGLFDRVTPCKFPWDTPCGIITEDIESNKKRIIVSGGFWVQSMHEQHHN